jgi:hypothetical protein
MIMTDEIILNVNKGMKAPFTFLHDTAGIKELSKEDLTKLLNTILKPFLLEGNINYDTLKDWSNNNQLQYSVIQRATKSSFYFIASALQENLTREQMIEDLDKLQLGKDKNEIILEFIDKDWKILHTSLLEGEGLLTTYFTDLRWRIDMRIRDNHRERIYSPSVFLFFDYFSRLTRKNETLVIEADNHDIDAMINQLKLIAIEFERLKESQKDFKKV